MLVIVLLNPEIDCRYKHLEGDHEIRVVPSHRARKSALDTDLGWH